MGLPARSLSAFIVVVICAVAKSVLIVHNGNGTIAFTILSAHFAAANSSFSVTAPPHFVSAADQIANTFPDTVANHIVFVDNSVSLGFVKLAQACQAVHCAGIVSADATYVLTNYQLSWSYRQHTTPFTNVPIVGIAPTVIPRLQGCMASDPTTTITITSDSAHPFSAFLLLPFVNVAYTAAFLINIALFLYALNLLIAFLVDGRGRLRRMPVLAGIVLVVQIVASAVRAMNFYDNAFAKGQTFPYFWWRTGQTVYIGLHYLTTATLAIVMYQTYMASRTGAKMGNCRKYAFSICIISIYAASGYDFVSTIISAYTEIEDRTMAAGEVLYIVLALPILITFIVYGSRVSALLTSNASKFGQDALMKRRLRFARRTLASGVVGIANWKLFDLHRVQPDDTRRLPVRSSVQCPTERFPQHGRRHLAALSTLLWFSKPPCSRTVQ